MKLRKVLSLLTILYLATAHLAAQRAPDRATTDGGKKHLLANYGKLPLVFELKEGQSDTRRQFISRGPGYALSLTPEEAVLAFRIPADIVQSKPGAFTLPSDAPGTVALHIKLLGANPKA